ncbi:MAG: hypothetical protein JRF40_15615 [Deltaproteobacteria bacterium]|nr:hypothetical protein [Deltaproteobacteria bacterium]
MSDIMPASRARILFLDVNYNNFDLNEKKRVLESVATHLEIMDFDNEERELWYERMSELDGPSRGKIRERLLCSIKKIK